MNKRFLLLDDMFAINVSDPMAKDLLIQPRVNYSQARPRGPFVRRIVLAALLVGAAAMASILVIRNRDSRAREYPPQPLAGTGVSGFLKTKWINQATHYIFELRPAAGNEERFDKILRLLPRDRLHFTIHLLDKDGFEVCAGVPQIHVVKGTAGRYTAIRTDQVLEGCDENQLRTVSKWHLSYIFPQLTDEIPSVLTQPVSPSPDPTTQITGVSTLSGKVETLDKGSFQVRRSAEYETLINWRPSDVVSIACNVKECLVTNIRTFETVHAVKR